MPKFQSRLDIIEDCRAKGLDSLSTKYAFMVAGRNDKFFRLAFTAVGVPIELLCMEKIAELKAYLKKQDLHFHHTHETGFCGREFILVIQNNEPIYMRQIK